MVKDPFIAHNLTLDGIALKTIPSMIKAKDLIITGDYTLKYNNLISNNMLFEANCSVNSIKAKTLSLEDWVRISAKQIDAGSVESSGRLTATKIKANSIKLWPDDLIISKCECTNFKQQDYKLSIDNIVADKIFYDGDQTFSIKSGTINLLQIFELGQLKIGPDVHIKKIRVPHN